MEKLYDFFSGTKPTIVGGVFLAASLILMLIGIEMPADPAWVTVLICGYPLMYIAVISIIEEKGMSKITSPLLISIAILACIGLSFAPDSHENMFAAGEVAFIMAIGAILEDRTIDRAKKGISKLISLVPEQGRIIIDGEESMKSVEQIKPGDVLRVLPGEAVPVDGEIISGDTSIDQSIITGESLPIDKSVGDSVFCGTINRFGSIDINATKTGEDSSLQKLIRMVQEAEENKAPTQRIADKWAGWLVPIALLVAIATYLVTWSMGYGDSLIRGVTVLVVFCPCALALATPTSIMAAIGQAAKHGVIIKSGDALERMGKVDTIAFDKTGTLTHGNLVVSDVIPFDAEMSEDGLLSLAASVESRSEHPLGKAVSAYAKEHEIALMPIEDFKMTPGKGVSADIGGSTIMCGNAAWLGEHGAQPDEKMTEALTLLRRQGKAAILVSDGNKCVGVIALSDTLRDTAKGMVQELSLTNADTVLLTGDHKQTADYFAEQADIKSVFSELLPAQKVERIKAMQADGRNVCMIGDGVNDAPALKTANVGIAMGSMGSDIAIDAADIALMGDDISKIPYLKRLSNATIRLIRFNISLSMFINFAAIILSVLALLNPITGALVHNAGSILVILNAALLYERKYV